MFIFRPWVVIEDSEIQLYVSRTFIPNKGKVIIKILSVSVLKFRRASANCEQDLIRPEEVKFILNGAFANSWLVRIKYYASGENRPEYAMTHLFEGVFKYYMSKMTLDPAVHLNVGTDLQNKLKKNELSCKTAVSSNYKFLKTL